MATELLFGVQTNGIRHAEADGMPDIVTRFRMVKEAGVHDYIDKTPDPHEIEEFEAASEKYGLPVRAGGWFYTLGRDEALFAQNIQTAERLGSLVHNTQILTNHADGHPVTNDEVIATYLNFAEIGDKHGVTPCFEVHVNMWSEDFRRVAEVGQAVEARGVPFNMTLDHSHVIFKIDNPAEQEIGDIRGDVESGKLILDPFKDGNVSDQWIDAGWIKHCHARAAIPNNPKNLDTVTEAGKPGRGIQYPFKQPEPGQYHSEWQEEALEPWKETIRSLMRHHAADPKGQLGQISTEFIPGPDYGQGCKYSLFEQSVACVQWMRETWTNIREAA
jgi:hypothetical protein